MYNYIYKVGVDVVYTSVDLGSDTIKIVVASKENNKFYILASTNVKSKGIKKGIIKDKDLVIASLKEAITNINQDLGLEIKEVVLNFPLFTANTSIETSEILVDGVVTGEHIKEIINKTVRENIPENLEILYLEPIVFGIDSDLQVVDPKGLTTSTLDVRCAVATIERDILYQYLSLLHEASLEVVDVTYGIVGDYFENVNHDTETKLGVVVNLGYGKTEVAIFNKGILLKGMCLPIGSSKIDKDISYIYKIDKKYATSLKENFAVASSKYADSNDIVEVLNLSGEEIKINQFELSQVVEARLLEIIKNVKNEINNLTNREIGYIIVTGGATNLTGFQNLLDQEFSCDKVVANVITLGVRSNIYSASLGLIKYFDYKMNFRNIKYTMISKEDIDILTSKKKEVSKARKNLMEKFETYLESN